jgi:hypothetical protein
MRELWTELRASREPGERVRDTLRLLAGYYRLRAAVVVLHLIGQHGPWMRCGLDPDARFCTGCGHHFARQLVNGTRR